MQNISDELKTKITKSTDDELIALGSINLKQYQSHIADFIKKEIEKRQLQNDVQVVLFDFFANGDGFAGRLILLEEQLLFLSIGIKAKHRSSGGKGIMGGLISSMKDADVVAQIALAASQNFSALENEGSWICYLDEIINCEAKSSWMSGKKMTIQVLEKGERNFIRNIKCDELSNDDFESLKPSIEKQKSKF